MESTLLGLKADSSDEFTPRLPEEGQDLVRRSGRATGTVTEDDKIDSTEEISPSLLLTGVVTSRIRPRNSSIGSVDEPGSATSRSDPLDETTTTKRRRRLSTDEADSIEVAVEGERQRKRIRADAGPAALSTSAAPNIARRDSARLNESPGGQSPQFEFPYNQPQNGQTDMPPPLEYGLPKPPGTEPRQRGSEAGIVPPQLHIAERQYQGTRHGPRGNSDFTLASALAPTSAVPTPMTHRSPIPSGSKDSSVKSPYPRHAQLYARSSGDIRVGSFEISGGIMGGPRTDSQHTGINLNQMDPSAAPTGAAQGSQPQGQVAQGTKMAMNLWQALGPTLLASLRPAPFTSSSLDEPPPPIDSGRRFPFERQDSAMSVEGRDKDRSLGMPRQELGNRGRSQQLQYPGPGPAVKPTLNAQGQRTCRQCGQPGRYKDGKCVEKWGPGPAGPGTLCERCRRKMKRVERRGTQDAGFLGQQIPLQALSSTQPQPPQLSPRQYYPPQSQPSYPREGQQYSLGEATPAREFQFQPPLSANSPTWVQGSKDWNTEGSYAWTGNITSPTSLQPKSNQPAPAKPQKRRAQTFSPPASPPLAD
ncbi:hypothetical protein M407DRAFT_7162 [Tulasnella calospora MUT 4182]|uniref:Uncharacterized protein n=1 Tax=Tulasnella calospora MUT 4182 TaxID=1051891 RepID=A0A0C3L1X8_9AGAM|nr:hypothetical protein M407DRAFT_7162 [Tulasnella calospora MUT 4182]